MLRVPAVDLQRAAASRLGKWQAEIDALPTHAERVEWARRRFKSRNVSGNATFREVREALGVMCSGNRRCGYCEDSVGDEVEHVAPKVHYPGLAFTWTNYLYACGPCNGPKNDLYAVRDATGLVHDLPRGGGPVPPPAGTPLLIDPRTEDPLELLELDLAGTFRIVPRPGLPAWDRQRAKWSIMTLDLNRTYLVKGRESHFGSYRARLAEYASKVAAGAPRAELDGLRDGLLDMSHPTVFREMQRQAEYDPAIEAMFMGAPEALAW